MLDCNAFIAKYYPNATETQAMDITRFVNRFEEVTGEKTPQETLTDTTTLCRLFYLQRLSSITRTHYQKIKEYLLNLFDWFDIKGEIPSREDVIKSGEFICFFKDLDSALTFIDKVGDNKLTDYNPNADLVTIKTIFILGWYGLSLAEIAGLKKSAVNEKIDNGYIVLENRTVAIDKRYFENVIALKHLDSYKSLPNGKIKYFKGGEDFMFRSTAGDCEQVKENHLVQMLKRFNSQVPFYLKQNIAFRYIHVNAMFIEIYNDKTDKPLIEKITQVTKCSPKQAYSYKTQYLAWVEMIDKKII